MQFRHAPETWIQVSVDLSQHLRSQESCKALFSCISTQSMREGGICGPNSDWLNFVVLHFYISAAYSKNINRLLGRL